MDITETQVYFTNFIRVLHGHIHDRFQPTHINGRHSDAFVYILQGSCRYVFETGRDFTVKQGDILYLANRSVYTMHIRTVDYVYVFCDFEIGDSGFESEYYTPGDETDAQMRFQRLLLHFQNPKDTSMCQCMAELYGIYGLIRQSASRQYLPRASRERIKASKLYMLDHLHDPGLTVAALAEQAGMSQVHFRNLFQSIFGMSPVQAMSTARINRAAELMIRYPFLPIADCAGQSGFTTVQYFNRCFKRSKGKTPAAWRKQMSKR